MNDGAWYSKLYWGLYMKRQILSILILAIFGSTLNTLKGISIHSSTVAGWNAQFILAIALDVIVGASLGALLALVFWFFRIVLDLERKHSAQCSTEEKYKVGFQKSHDQTGDALKQAEIASQKLHKQTEMALKLAGGQFPKRMYREVLKNDNLSAPMCDLLLSSVASSSKKVYGVNGQAYLNILKGFILQANSYYGIQRNPIRWYENVVGADEYMHLLQHSEMTKKVRIFIIPDKLVPAMEGDLSNIKTMVDYWKKTGSSVSSYWLRESEIREDLSINKYKEISDCAYYDEKMLLRYPWGEDESRLTEYFKKKDLEDSRNKIPKSRMAAMVVKDRAKIRRTLHFDFEPSRVEIDIFERFIELPENDKGVFKRIDWPDQELAMESSE